MSTPDVAVVGGGIIGLSIAWRVAQRGLSVVVHDPALDDEGAWHVAAGMLAAGGESTFERPALGRLLAESARRWPGFAAELERETGHRLGYDETGTLSVALTGDDVVEAAREWTYRGLTALRPGALRELEPALSPRVRAGALVADDRQVDPRRVVAALRSVLPVSSERITDLSRVNARTIVAAAGCGTAALTGLPVRPVKGQLLRLRGEPGLFRHVLNGVVDGRHVYLVPRADGEVVVGATQEERTDRAVTAGGVLELLRAAIDLVPGLNEFELTEVLVGHRPATPDNAPLLGALPSRSAAPAGEGTRRGGEGTRRGGEDTRRGGEDACQGRVVVAAGHHRNGVLLAPVTADLIADLVAIGVADPLLDEFRPGRFTCA
jgi:glycine oxidase